MAFDLSDLLQKYLNPVGGTPSADVARHYDQVAQHASPQVMKQGIADALRSDETPALGQMGATCSRRRHPNSRREC